MRQGAWKVADGVPHGTQTGYQNWGCRCQPCKDAHALRRDEMAARRYLARFGIDLDDVMRQDARERA